MSVGRLGRAEHSLNAGTGSSDNLPERCFVSQRTGWVGLVRSSLIRFGLVWFGLVWLGLVRSGLIGVGWGWFG